MKQQSANDIDDFTSLLIRAELGDTEAESELFEAVDAELRRIAVGVVSGWHGARATSLVNDAYVFFFQRIKVRGDLSLKNRRYFFAAMADRMRKVLIDRVRKRRPGPWDEAFDMVLADLRTATSWDVVAMHRALERFLKSEDPKQRRRHQLVNLHFFGGLTYRAAADTLGISTTQYQIDRDRALAELQQAITHNLP